MCSRTARCEAPLLLSSLPLCHCCVFASAVSRSLGPSSAGCAWLVCLSVLISVGFVFMPPTLRRFYQWCGVLQSSSALALRLLLTNRISHNHPHRPPLLTHVCSRGTVTLRRCFGRSRRAPPRLLLCCTVLLRCAGLDCAVRVVLCRRVCLCVSDRASALNPTSGSAWRSGPLGVTFGVNIECAHQTFAPALPLGPCGFGRWGAG